MTNFNLVVLAGRITNDPELRYTQKGDAVCSFNLAVNKVQGSGEDRKEEALFIKVTAWKRTAELICQYCKKGSGILVQGELKMETWEKDGVKHNRISVTANSIQFIGGKKDDTTPGAGQDEQAQPEPEEA